LRNMVGRDCMIVVGRPIYVDPVRMKVCPVITGMRKGGSQYSQHPVNSSR